MEHRQRDRGAETVEFVLILSLILIPFLTALISFGFAFSAQISITQAAREGARQAAICNLDTTCLGAADATIRSYVADHSAVTLDPNSATQITVTDCNATSGDAEPTATVVIKYVSGVGIPPFAQYGLTLTGKASTPCGG